LNVFLVMPYLAVCFLGSACPFMTKSRWLFWNAYVEYNICWCRSM